MDSKAVAPHSAVPNEQIRPRHLTNPPTSISILSQAPSTTTATRSTTPRLTLRPLAMTDLQACYRLRSQPAVMAWQTQARPDQSIDETRAWLAKRTAWPAFVCGIELRCGGGVGGGLSACEEGVNEEGGVDIIGVVGCHTLEPVATCGFLLSRECWGRGLATEALGGWLGLWWARIGELAQRSPGQSEQSALTDLFAFCNIENESSRRVLMKCGFRAIGVERKFESERWIEVETWCILPPS